MTALSASKCALACRRAVVASLCGIAVPACDRWPESDQLVADRFDKRLQGELRNAVSAKQPVRLDKVATFQWDTAYFYSSNRAETEIGSAIAARKAAESTGNLTQKQLDVVIVFMDKGLPVHTITRFYGNTGVVFRVPHGAPVAKDAAIFDLILGTVKFPELRLKTG